MAQRRGRIQCLDRALDVLEALSAEGPLTAPELAARLELNASTVHNIASTLAARAYLINHAGRYQIGPGAAVLAGSWDPVAALPRLAGAHLDAVVAATGESAVLTVLLGEVAVMVAFAVGPGEVTAQFPRREYPFPLTIATGRVLVADGDEASWPGIIERHRAGGSVTSQEAGWDLARWEDELRGIREAGLAQFCRPGGVCAIAVPVRGPAAGHVLAALGVSCPAFRADENHRALMGEAIGRSARNLSAALGAGLCLDRRPTP